MYIAFSMYELFGMYIMEKKKDEKKIGLRKVSLNSNY